MVEHSSHSHAHTHDTGAVTDEMKEGEGCKNVIDEMNGDEKMSLLHVKANNKLSKRLAV